MNIALFSLTLILSLTPALIAQGRPATAGQVELRKYESTHQPEPPPAPQQPPINNAQLVHDANELSSLAQSIPPDRNQSREALSRKTCLKD